MRRIAALLVCALLAAAVSSPALAGLRIGYVTRSVSGRTITNRLALHGLPWSDQFRQVHDVEALDVARADLVRRGRLRDLPVLLVTSDRRDQPDRLSIEPDCAVSYGDAEPPAGLQPVGECYRIGMSAYHPIEDQLAMVLTLPAIAPGAGPVEVADLPALRRDRAGALPPYRNMVLHFDPVWSPDGRRLVYAAWRAGTVRLELLEASSGAVRVLEPLEGYLSARPVWSPDARFVAYAAIGMVKVYDRTARRTRTFRPQGASGGMETLLQFEGSRLRFAFDGGFYSDYQVYLYDTTRRALQRLAPDALLPDEDAAHDLDRHASILAVRSPNRRWLAVFTFPAGQRRIQVRAARR